MENYTIFAPNITRTTLPHNKQNNDFVDPNSNICNTMTDKIIRENFNCGDIKIFEEIYNKNHPKLVSFAYSYLNDIDEAKNVAHDVFIAFWKNKNNVNLQENVMPYLFASTKNMCLNLLRKKNYALKYSEHTIREKTNYLNTIALENNSSIKIYESDVENIISRGMTQMKPKVRQTFLMSRVKGLKNREIASAEGVAESTVEARITSALLVMRKLLKDYL
ncbi:MAG: RNA polymerase sigma-70 factor [Bacteroidales bacterium]